MKKTIEAYRRVRDLFDQILDIMETFDIVGLPATGTGRAFKLKEMQPYTSCPFCHLNLEEYLKTVDKNKQISVDVPSDMIAAEKLIGREALIKIVNEYNRGKRMQFKVPEGEVCEWVSICPHKNKKVVEKKFPEEYNDPHSGYKEFKVVKGSSVNWHPV